MVLSCSISQKRLLLDVDITTVKVLTCTALEKTSTKSYDEQFLYILLSLKGLLKGRLFSKPCYSNQKNQHTKEISMSIIDIDKHYISLLKSMTLSMKLYGLWTTDDSVSPKEHTCTTCHNLHHCERHELIVPVYFSYHKNKSETLTRSLSRVYNWSRETVALNYSNPSSISLRSSPQQHRTTYGSVKTLIIFKYLAVDLPLGVSTS